MLVSIDRHFNIAIDAVRVVFNDQPVETGVFRLNIVDYQAAFAVVCDDLTVFSSTDEWHIIESPLVLWIFPVNKGCEPEGGSLRDGLSAWSRQPSQFITMVVIFRLVQALRMI